MGLRCEAEGRFKEGERMFSAEARANRMCDGTFPAAAGVGYSFKGEVSG